MAAALCCLASCDDEAHEEEIGVAVAIGWQDADDKDTEVDDIRLWMYNADGTPAGEYHHTDPRDMAGLYTLPAGNYLFVTATNLVEPFTAETATVRSTEIAGSLQFSISDSDASPDHAHYSVTEVNVNGNGVQTVSMPLKRILAELTVTITNVPEGTVLTGTVENAASGLFPTVKDAEGGYGTTSATAAEAALPETTAEGDRLQSAVFRLMPTVNGDVHSLISLRLRLSDGSVNEYTIEAPVMKPAGKYLFDMDFEEMRPYICLSAHEINGWTEGWTIDGEIPNPTD